MGNKLGRKRQTVEERYTKPQEGLYMFKDVDIKKLRKLILQSKLAPCYPGQEDQCHDLEECPICFLYYPSLNRSRCCMKSICTECFLRMKNPNSAQPTRCPFCKTSNYAVEYRGGKTKEEKSIEQIEDQRVIEAKIRMRQKEVQEDEDRSQKRLESFSSSTSTTTVVTDYGSAPEDEEVGSSSHDSGEFDFDLEEIMIKEAIWLSKIYHKMEHATTLSSSPSSPSGGLACAIAVLAERQQTVGESSSSDQNSSVSSHNMAKGSCNSNHYITRSDMIDG